MCDYFLDMIVFIEQFDSGWVVVIQFGIKGMVCCGGWDSMVVLVFCWENGFSGGVVYSFFDEFMCYEFIWVGSIKVRQFCIMERYFLFLIIVDVQRKFLNLNIFINILVLGVREVYKGLCV